MFRLEDDPEALVGQLEALARESEELASRESLRGLARKRTHAGKPLGYEGISHRYDFGYEVDIQGWRTAGKKTEKELYWEIQGIDPDLSTGEKIKATNQFLKQQQERADWYYTLAMQAQNLAQGKAPGELATMIPETLARESLERLEAFEGLREIEDLAEIRARQPAASRAADNMHGLPVAIEDGIVKCTIGPKNFRLLSFTE